MGANSYHHERERARDCLSICLSGKFHLPSLPAILVLMAMEEVVIAGIILLFKHPPSVTAAAEKEETLSLSPTFQTEILS